MMNGHGMTAFYVLDQFGDLINLGVNVTWRDLMDDNGYWTLPIFFIKRNENYL